MREPMMRFMPLSTSEAMSLASVPGPTALEVAVDSLKGGGIITVVEGEILSSNEETTGGEDRNEE